MYNVYNMSVRSPVRSSVTKLEYTIFLHTPTPRLLGIRWFHFVTNTSVTSQTGEGLAIRICRRRLSIFGDVRRLPEATPAHSALRLTVDARAGGKPDIRPEWNRQRGRPCRTWVQQIEDDTGLNANDAWRIAHDRKSWRALPPVAGQAFH